MTLPSGRREWKAAFVTFFGLLSLTSLALAVGGYHLGIEDQAIYLPAIKQLLHPGLYPHDSELFAPQTSETIFPQLIAASVRASHAPLEWVIFWWQQASVLLFLAGALRLARLLFSSPRAHAAAVTTLAAVLSLPVAGSALYIIDPDLHPRTLATALLLFMLAEVLEKRLVRAAILLALAALVHIQMAFYGALVTAFLLLPDRCLLPLGLASSPPAAAAFVPFSSLFEPATPAWRQAARTRWQHHLLRWPWYAWAGIWAPLALLLWFSHLGESKRLPRVRAVAARLVSYGVFIFVAAAALTIPAALERFTPYQPMRGYQLLYVFLFLITGGLLGEFLLKSRAWRWLALFLPLCAVMFYGQRLTLPESPHIEWPGVQERNPWRQAFAWVRANTPRDAYFALDPRYMQRPQEEYHGFRALAERSMMADYVKDSGVALLLPAVAGRWLREVNARAGWGKFTAADFSRLRRDYGVNWVIVERGYPPAPGLDCPYANPRVAVCRVE